MISSFTIIIIGFALACYGVNILFSKLSGIEDSIAELREIKSSIDDFKDTAGKILFTLDRVAERVLEEGQWSPENSCCLKLISSGSRKIGVMAAVHKIGRIDLSEVQKLVEQTPSEIPFTLSQSRATYWKEILELAGASVEITPFQKQNLSARVPD